MREQHLHQRPPLVVRRIRIDHHRSLVMPQLVRHLQHHGAARQVLHQLGLGDIGRAGILLLCTARGAQVVLGGDFLGAKAERDQRAVRARAAGDETAPPARRGRRYAARRNPFVGGAVRTVAPGQVRGRRGQWASEARCVRFARSSRVLHHGRRCCFESRTSGAALPSRSAITHAPRAGGGRPEDHRRDLQALPGARGLRGGGGVQR